MAMLEIQDANRAGSRLVFMFAGQTETGKTLTAILFGYGLANYNSAKLGFLCTENRRGRLYADKLPGGAKFKIADFQPPFSPERFIEAIGEYQKAGVEVLIIDSGTHEWSGIGGCLEIAEKITTGKDKWTVVMPRHDKFVNYMLQSPMHIIVCLRAKNKSIKVKEIDKDGKEKTVWHNLGIQPIQQSNFMFEMTASLMMHDKGMRQTILKCPHDLLPFLGRKEGYITPEDGKAVRDWVDGGGVINPEVDRWRDIVIVASGKGSVELKRVWETEVPPAIKKLLGRLFITVQKEAAFASDQSNKEKSTGNSAIDAINAGKLTRTEIATPDDDEEPEDEFK